MKINKKKILKNIHIHPLTGLVFIFGVVTNTLVKVVLLYGIVLIHEMFHLLAAYLLRLEVAGLAIMPFGVNLRLKDSHIRNPVKEIIVAAAGPFSNLMMILIGYVVQSYCLLDTDNMTFFIYANIVVTLMNLVPALPLDGGRILKGFLAEKLGSIRAFGIVIIITKFVIAALFAVGIYAFYVTGFNFSVLLICFFLAFNIAGERNSYNITLMKEIVQCKEKLSGKGIFQAKNLVVLHDVAAQRILKYFSYNRFFIVTVIDSKMNIMGVLTEVQIMECMTREGCHITMGDIVKTIENGTQ